VRHSVQMEDPAKSLMGVLAKRRRLTLALTGRPRISALPLRVMGDQVKVYQRSGPRGAGTYALPMAQIESVWDPISGACLWRCR
jgi:hypothetical protein